MVTDLSTTVGVYGLMAAALSRLPNWMSTHHRGFPCGERHDQAGALEHPGVLRRGLRLAVEMLQPRRIFARSLDWGLLRSTARREELMIVDL
jgi:hypothetical protein